MHWVHNARRDGAPHQHTAQQYNTRPNAHCQQALHSPAVTQRVHVTKRNQTPTWFDAQSFHPLAAGHKGAPTTLAQQHDGVVLQREWLRRKRPVHRLLAAACACNVLHCLSRLHEDGVLLGAAIQLDCHVARAIDALPVVVVVVVVVVLCGWERAREHKCRRALVSG